MDFSTYLQQITKQINLSQPYISTDVLVRSDYTERTSRYASTLKFIDNRVSVLEVLKTNSHKGHLLLLGKQGMGKSTALRQLHQNLAQLALVDERCEIPVSLRLQDNLNIPDAICAEFQRAGLSVTIEQVNQLLLDKRLFLLLDGLDEIAPEKRQREVGQFRRQYPDTKMVFTARDSVTELGIEHKFKMTTLTQWQIKSLVETYLPEYAQVLLHQLQNRPGELAATPLIIKLLCEVFDPVSQQIPQNEIELLQAVDARNNTKIINPIENIERFWRWNREVLKYLAFHMVRGDGNSPRQWWQIGRDRVQDILKQVLPSDVTQREEIAQAWLQCLLEHHVLQIAANSNQIEFRHHLFQEYYAAEHLLRQLPNLSDIQLKRDYLNFVKWTEPLLIILSLLEDKEQVLRIVRLAIEVDMMLGVRLARAVKPAFQTTTAELIDALTIPAGLIDCLPLTNPQETLSKLLQIQEKSREQRISELLPSLDGDDNNAKMTAASELGILGAVEAIPQLLQAIEQRNPHVRQSAAEALKKIGTTEAIAGLLQALTHTNPTVRALATQVLGELNNIEFVPRLLNTLTDPDAKVRNTGVMALVKLNTPEALQGLLNVLDDPNSIVRNSAVLALDKFESTVAIPRLLNALKDPEAKIRSSALSVLKQFNSPEAVAAILDALNDSDSNVRSSAVLALDKLDADESLPRILNALKDPDTKVRQNAILILEKLPTSEALLGLSQALEDPDINVRKSVITSLERIGNVNAIAGLLKALEDSTIAEYATYAFKRLNLLEAIPELIQALEHPLPHVRSSIANILGALGHVDAIPKLLQTLKDPNPIVRERAAFALEKFGRIEAIPELLIALKSSNSSVCISAVEALGNLGSSQAIPELITAFYNGDKHLQTVAAKALGKLGCQEIIPGLLNALDSRNISLIATAGDMLGQLGYNAAISKLVQIADRYDEWPNEELGAAAAGALRSFTNIAAIPSLIVALWSSNSWVFASVAVVLEQLGTPAIPELIKALESSSDSLRANAAYILGKLECTEAVPGLLKLLDDKKSYIRDRATQALKRIGHHDAIAKMWAQILNPSSDIPSYSIARINEERYQTIISIQSNCGIYSRDVYL